MNSLLRRLDALLHSILHPLRSSDSGKEIQFESGQSFILNRKETQNYIDLLQDWRNSVTVEEDFDETAAKRILDKAVETTVLPSAVLRPAQRMKLAVRLLEKELDVTTSLWQVYFPVRNLNYNGLPRSFGKVVFLPMGRRLRNEFLTRTNAILNESLSPPSERLRHRQSVFTFFQKEIGAKKDIGRAWGDTPILAEVLVFAKTAKGARAEATRQLRLTLDVLNLYADILADKGLRAFVYLPGESTSTNRLVPAFRLDSYAEDEIGSYEAVRSGPMRSMILAGPDLKFAERWGFNEVSRLLSLPETAATDFDRRLLAALRWAGRATTKHLASSGVGLNSVRDEAFLYFAIALESLLFSRTEKRGITERLSLRSALLVADPSDYFMDVERYKSLMRNLYRVRSMIVHNGNSHVSESDAITMKRIVRMAIFRVLLGEEFSKMRRDSQFEKWFSDKVELHDFEAKFRNASSLHLKAVASSLSTIQAHRLSKIEELVTLIQTPLNNLHTVLSNIAQTKNSKP